MSKGDLGLHIFGRPIKPVAIGLTFIMCALIFYNVENTGRLGASWLGDIVAILAGISAVSMLAGWVFNNQHMAELGLLITAGVMVARSSFIYLTIGAQEQSMWMGIGMAIVGGGAYLLERTDEKRYP